MVKPQRVRSLLARWARARTVAVATGVALLIGCPAASAYVTWSDRHLTYGVSGQKYWISDGAASFAGTAINSSVSLWNATSTPVSYSRTTTKSASRLDWYHVTTDDGFCAVTRMFVNTTNVNGATGAPTSNWWWAKVNIRTIFHDTDLCGPTNHRPAVLAHEMGHAMGLAHAPGSVLMNAHIAWSDFYGINAPRADDIAGIKHLY